MRTLPSTGALERAWRWFARNLNVLVPSCMPAWCLLRTPSTARSLAWLLMLMLGFGAWDAYGQADSTAADSTGNLLVLPNLFYTPETKIAGGLVLGYYRTLDAQSPGSSFQMAAIYTQRHQFYIQMLPDAYWNRGRWWADGEVWLSRYPDAFYGIGPSVPAANEEEYTSRIADVQLRLQRRIRPGWRAGGQIRVRTEAVTERAEGGLLATQSIVGQTGATSVGGGLITTWDRRDNRYFPRSGSYVEAWGMFEIASAERGHTAGRVVVDARRYVRVAETHVLALQAYTEAVAGTVPFQLLPLLGGTDLMRGYREGRYRDHLFGAVQAAYRMPLVWRFKGVVFANAGRVAPRLGAFRPGELKYALGAGLRLRLNEEGVHGRVDYAVGADGGALYVTLLEAF